MDLNRFSKQINIKRLLIIAFVIYSIILIIGISIAYNQQRLHYDIIIREMRNDINTQHNIIHQQIREQIDLLEDRTNELQNRDEEITSELADIKVAKAELAAKQKSSSDANPSISVVTITDYQVYAKNLCLNTYEWTEYDFEVEQRKWLESKLS